MNDGLINIISAREGSEECFLSSQPSNWTDRDISLWDSADFASFKKTKVDSKENSLDYTTTPRRIFKQNTVRTFPGVAEPTASDDTRNQQWVSRKEFFQQNNLINKRLDRIISATLSLESKITKLTELYARLLARQNN